MANDEQLFRAEALEHHRKPRIDGAVIRGSSRWTHDAYWLLVWMVGAALAYVALGTVHEYAEGVAVIQVDGHDQLTAHVEGTIAEVLTRPGQHVARGEVLARFYVEGQRAELARVADERRTALLRLLRNPGDHEARVALGGLHAEHALVERSLAQHELVAPRSGTIADLRIRVGQAVHAGDGLVTLIGDRARARVLAIVPAQYRPKLRPGLTLRLELQGFRFAYRELRIEQVGDEAVGPAEVQRYLGPDHAGAIATDGPVVLVEASIPSLQFESSGASFAYHDGMVGSADVRLRTEPIALALVPGLRDLLEGRP